MKKEITNEVIEQIAERMEGDFEIDLSGGVTQYHYFYGILQEAIEYVTEYDEESKTIDINDEFTYYINNVLEDMGYPSMNDLDDNSKDLVNSLYDEFFDYLESIVEDVEDEYSDVDIDIDDNMIVVTAED